uniref:Adenylate kinase active site lid domain-containing protein n=1 Tax=Lotharella oceanica TaxID=641309 RepID=A0A7S2TF23_9EUKA
MRDIIILLGPPGAGKGTVAPVVKSKLGVPQLSTGDLLRKAVREDSKTAREIKAIMQKGELVPDGIVMELLKDRILHKDCDRGFILDGFPRTLEQARALDALLTKMREKVTMALYINVDPSVLEKRICGRWCHKPSGRVYHVSNHPPKSMKLKNGKADPETMRDDLTGGPLYQRADDTPEALRRRLVDFHKHYDEILAYYRKVKKTVNGNGSIAQVRRRVSVIMDDHMTSTFVVRNAYNLVDASPKSKL